MCCFFQEEIFSTFDNNNLNNNSLQMTENITLTTNRADDYDNNNNNSSAGESDSVNTTDAKSDSPSTSNSSFDDGLEISSCDTVSMRDAEEIDVNDILDLYDNVEFYRENDGTQTASVSRNEDVGTSNLPSDHTENVCSTPNKNESIQNLETSKQPNQSSKESYLVQLVNESIDDVDSFNSELNKNDKESPNVVLQIKSDSKEITPVHQGCPQSSIDPVTESSVDHLEGYKSQELLCNSQVSSKQYSQAKEQPSLDLQFQYQEKEHTCGSSGKRITQAVSFISARSQNSGSQPAYQEGDNNKLDNGVSGNIIHSKIEEGVIMSNGLQKTELTGCDDANNSHCNKGHSLDLEEFLEEINDSIDELISGDQFSGAGNDTASGKLNVCGPAKNPDSTCSKNSSGINKEMSFTNEGLSGGKGIVEPGKMGDAVVETDAGYYWLTSSIEQGKKQNVIDSEGLDEVDGNIDNETTSQIRNTSEKVEDVGAERFDENWFHNTDRCLDEFADDIHEKIEYSELFDTNESEAEKKSVNTKCPSSQKFDNAITTSLEDVHEHENNNEVPEINTSFGSDDNSSFISSTETLVNSDDVNHLHHLSVSSVDKEKRKYSCPENLFRVFKVVSVDIPKINNVKNNVTNSSRPKSFSTLPDHCSKSVGKKRNSLEQKKAKILAYLEELNSITVNFSKTNVENDENVKEESTDCNNPLQVKHKTEELQKNSVDSSVMRNKMLNGKENVDRKSGLTKDKLFQRKQERGSCDTSKHNRVLRDIQIEQTPAFRDGKMENWVPLETTFGLVG